MAHGTTRGTLTDQKVAESTVMMISHVGVFEILGKTL